MWTENISIDSWTTLISPNISVLCSPLFLLALQCDTVRENKNIKNVNKSEDFGETYHDATRTVRSPRCRADDLQNSFPTISVSCPGLLLSVISAAFYHNFGMWSAISLCNWKVVNRKSIPGTDYNSFKHWIYYYKMKNRREVMVFCSSIYRLICISKRENSLEENCSIYIRYQGAIQFMYTREYCQFVSRLLTGSQYRYKFKTIR